MAMGTISLSAVGRKRCKRCGSVLPISVFTPRKDRPGFYRPCCRPCEAEKRRLSRLDPVNAERERETAARSRKKHIVQRRRDNAEWVKRNPEKVAEHRKRWRERHPDRYREFNNLKTQKRKRDPKMALHANISRRISFTLKGGKNGAGWEVLVGYTAAELKTHIERQFLPGMTWGKYLNGEIHIDHILAAASFSFTSPEDDDFKACWALTNLRPLWALDNIKKRDRRTMLI